jgi:putative toxin-antitoxin system antitoxin component (TIGR02293 family)
MRTKNDSDKLVAQTEKYAGKKSSWTGKNKGFTGRDPEEILKGYGKVYNKPLEKLVLIKKGLNPGAINDLIAVTGRTQMDIAHILSLTEPTLRSHIKGEKDLNTGLSEHILQLFELFDKGIDTFGSLEEFKNWLPKHNIGINAIPIDLLDTITGINIVMSELIRIDFGLTA